MGFLIPISTAAVTGILPSILLGLWLISRHYHGFPILLKKSLATQLSIALFVWLALAGLIGGGGLDSVTFLKKYRELILIPIFIGFTIHMSSRERFHICLALNVGLLVTLAVSLLQIFEILPLRDGQPTLSSTLTQASLMSWGMFWMMHQFRQTRSVKWLIGALVVATYSIFLMQSTTGLLLIVVMLGLFGLQTMRWKSFVTVITIACGVIFGAYMSIDQFKVELDESIIVGIKFLKSEQLDEGQLATSPGERYEFVSNGVKLFLQKPLIGHGPGSVEQQYGELTSGTHSKRTTNLHNEYLMIGAQSGVIGIFLWIGVLWAIVTTINCNGMTERCLLQGIVVWMAVGCLVNSFLLDAREGMLFALMTAVLCVPKFKKDNDYQAFSFHSRT
tara:strand:- start:761 stop:1930 length:1170 start_codon:yes stop_codon:yes gene_type:complete